MKVFSCAILLGMVLVTAYAQDHPGECPSNMQVVPGESIVVGCEAQVAGYTYQWTSQDPSWLSYLSDVGVASPRINVPMDVEFPMYLVYTRTVVDGRGDPVYESMISITVQQAARSGDTETRKLDWMELDGIRLFGGKSEKRGVVIDGDGAISGEESLFLQCASRITAYSGEFVEIPCTVLHPAGGVLEYRVEFDWPPYRQTGIFDEGALVYTVRAPMIEGVASVQTLEIFAEEPNLGEVVSERVELHVVNRAPRLLCEDITVDGGGQLRVPCSVTAGGRIQIISELGPRGIHDDWPMLSIPEVGQDTLFMVTARVFGSDGDSVAETDFAVQVRQIRTPLDVDVSCSADPHPLPYEEYEGAAASELRVTCTVQASPTSGLVWVWSAEGTTPLEALDLQFENGQPVGAIISVPQEVDGTEIWEYALLVTANEDDAGEDTGREEINITILERPDISIDCEDVRVRTGNPPLALICTPLLDSAHRDAPLEYTWEWESEDGLALLSGDLSSAMPVFNVPGDQDLPTVEYAYQVTASAENTDPPQNPATLTVTVEKFLGKLVLGCTSPIELYAGDSDFPLDCAISGADVSDLSWTWQLQEGPEDRLVAGAPGSPPIFRTPEFVEETETYRYDIRAGAPFYDTSEPESVEIIVLQRPTLSIECEDVRVRTGDPPLELKCAPFLDIPHRDAMPDYRWIWTSENGLDLLSGDLSSAMPVFNVPGDQALPAVEYIYQVTASAEQIASPQNPAMLTVTVEKYPSFLECPEEIVVTVGMPPQRIECSVTSDQDVTLDYVWQWTPEERLSDTSTGRPLFDVPTRQREYSRTYLYTVTVSAERAISDAATVLVRVLNPSGDLAEQVEISSSELDFGVVGPDGQVLLDPATELISGLVYDGGQSHAGRMVIQARDSVTVLMEQLQSAVLRHVDSGQELTLIPRLAYSASCTTLAANTQSSRIVQTLLTPGDCYVLRVGGTITLAQAEPGAYSGSISVVITVNGLDQLHTVPVVLKVEPQRRAVLLGPGGVAFRAVQETGTALDWEQRISIEPQVAVLGPQTRSGVFSLTNPSIHPMEVEVSTEFGYREARADERFSVGVTAQEEVHGDLAAVVTVHPSIVLLAPGETRPVHYAIPDHVPMRERGYAGRFNFTVTPREFIDQSQSPASLLAARITFQAPGVYIPSLDPAVLQASATSLTEENVGILVEADTIPFYGEVIVLDDSKEELGRSELLVYTRSHVRIPIQAAVVGGITLRFVSYVENQQSPSDVYIPLDS